jgi:hypothetical protein
MTGAGGDPGAAMDKIACGSDLCDKAMGQDCCISFSGFSPSYSCVQAGKCMGGFVNVDQPCDGPEDCTGNACCASFSGTSGKIECSMGASCPMSSGQGAQLCHLDSDCPNSEPCSTCTFMGGVTFRVCGMCPGG